MLTNFITDWRDFWTDTLGFHYATNQPPTRWPVASDSAAACSGEPAVGLLSGLVDFCPGQNDVAYDEPTLIALHERVGDFAVAYLLGVGYAEAALDAIDSPLTGVERALTVDCMIGGWAQGLFPNENGFTERYAFTEVRPGDLDEVVITMLNLTQVADEAEIGDPFAKTAALRYGVLEGIASCGVDFPAVAAA